MTPSGAGLYVLGDCHKTAHIIIVLDGVGQPLEQMEILAGPRGCARAIALALRHPGIIRDVSFESARRLAERSDGAAVRGRIATSGK